MTAKTYYNVKNISGSEGQILLDGKYIVIYPGQEIELEKCPTNRTANICISTFRRHYSEPLEEKNQNKNAKEETNSEEEIKNSQEAASHK